MIVPRFFVPLNLPHKSLRLISAAAMASGSPSKQKEPPQAPASSKRPNACTSITIVSRKRALNSPVTELMSARTKKPRAETPPPPPKGVFDARDGLIVYIEHPERNPEGRIVEYDDDFVVVRDKFPKARYLHPFLQKEKTYLDRIGITTCHYFVALTSSFSPTTQKDLHRVLYRCPLQALYQTPS